MSSKKPSCLLPPYVVLITVVHSVTGEELSTYAWSDSNIEKITNTLIGLKPSTFPSSKSSKSSTLTSSILSSIFPNNPLKYLPHESPENLFLLIPSNGESTPDNNYLKLANQFALPDTSILSLLGSQVLPFDLGYAWYQDTSYTTGSPLPPSSTLKNAQTASTSFQSSVSKLYDYFNPESIFILSYGTGSNLSLNLLNSSSLPLGGLICISPLQKFTGDAGLQIRTPVLEILKNDRGLKGEEFEDFTSFKSLNKGMGISKEECGVVMGFLGRKLGRKMKGMEGMCTQP